MDSDNLTANIVHHLSEGDDPNYRYRDDIWQPAQDA
jgi:hypothetical protein